MTGGMQTFKIADFGEPEPKSISPSCVRPWWVDLSGKASTVLKSNSEANAHQSSRSPGRCPSEILERTKASWGKPAPRDTFAISGTSLPIMEKVSTLQRQRLGAGLKV